jgi:hypothetical protein
MAANPSAIGVRLLTTLVEKVPAEEVAEVIRDLLRATSTVRTGSESFKEVPDYRAREAGAKLYFGYMLGLPVQRTIEIQHREERNEDTLERMLASPAARAALTRALAEEV